MWFILLLILWPIIFFILISLILLPFHFTIYSLFNIITIPFQLIKIAFNKNLRNNHALEHATINILESKFGYHRLAGFAREDGFVVQGRINPYHLQEAASLGLQLLKKGNHNLAVHNNCGTSMLGANFTAAIIFLLLLWVTGTLSILNIILAIIAAHLLGPKTGKILQKFLTTSTKVDDMVISGINYRKPHSIGAIKFNFPGLYSTPAEFFVKTERTSSIEIIR